MRPTPPILGDHGRPTLRPRRSAPSSSPLPGCQRGWGTAVRSWRRAGKRPFDECHPGGRSENRADKDRRFTPGRNRPCRRRCIRGPHLCPRGRCGWDPQPPSRFLRPFDGPRAAFRAAAARGCGRRGRQVRSQRVPARWTRDRTDFLESRDPPDPGRLIGMSVRCCGRRSQRRSLCRRADDPAGGEARGSKGSCEQLTRLKPGEILA